MKQDLKTRTTMAKQTRLQALNRQIDRIQRRVAHLRCISYRYTWLRITVFVAGLLATGLSAILVDQWLAALCLLVGVALFGLTVYAHHRVETAIDRYQIWLGHKAAQIARARLDWEQIPAGFYHRARSDHPFEADLDLVGDAQTGSGGRSLHRLLDTAVSFEGSQRLRDWLAAPIPDPAQTVRRQQQVRELVPRSLFREKLVLHATLAAGASRTWRANQLVEWLARSGPGHSLGHWLLILVGLAALNAMLLYAYLAGWLPAWWLATFGLYLALSLYKTRDTDTIWDEAQALEGALRQLREVFRQLETFSYQPTPHLATLCQPFLDSSHRPSSYLARLTRVVAAMGLRENPMIRLALNAVVPWDLYFAHRLDHHKAGMAEHAPAWMDAWFELEALSSLANLAYLKPEYTFPALLDGEGPEPSPVFQAEGLGHPLIPDGEKVCNDFSVPRLGQVTLITGSNMAGKSVFLKTVGLNLALAYAGGPVDARALQTVAFRLFTCMGISDSVTDGISYFYAEVKRLKALLTELERDHPLPLLYAIDEIFRGTNNRERLTGSRAYVRALAGRRGVGLIATHDLELARLAEELPQVENVHFRDQVVGERMVFDYKLHPGQCPTTNALKIMQLEGLPVG
jgi:hypothetical protein